ncbi:response regulator [Thiotrichales bacterium 19S3-7]|nr:response regulator [Thiotrichales bacterium 19S3-7]MCF6801138.1 response regulator [Thiotrichales bacterium 19S3-11]
METRILIVDDEAQIRKFVKMTLKAHDYEVLEAIDATNATRLLVSDKPDLVILDLGLPDQDGIHWLNDMRQWSDVPVIVLSARDEESQIVKALDLGANDYVTKPFEMPVLMARIRAVLRSQTKEVQEYTVYHFANMIVNIPEHRIMIGDEIISLSKKEFQVLSLLVKHAGKLVTQQQILTKIWGSVFSDEPQYLRVYVGQLRKKLSQCDIDPLIETESGIGYRFAKFDHRE